MPNDHYKIVVLISGNGSNLQAIIDAIKTHHWPIEIAAVISDQPTAYGLQRATQAGISTQVLSKAEYPRRADYDQHLKKIIDAYQPDLLVLAGFMRILTPEFVTHYQGKLINIHPSLLPNYKGLHTHQRALDAGEQYHGVSVHFVTEELDGGPLIAQMKFAIESNDDATSLQQRIHQLEHRLYPTIILWLAQKRLLLTASGVQFDNDYIATNGMELTKEQLAC